MKQSLVATILAALERFARLFGFGLVPLDDAEFLADCVSIPYRIP